jgi:hypothetical protein
MTTEYAFVSVPLTSDLTIAKPDGTGQIDVDKLVQRAVEMAQAPGVAWQKEEQQIKPHPIQRTPTDLENG